MHRTTAPAVRGKEGSGQRSSCRHSSMQSAQSTAASSRRRTAKRAADSAAASTDPRRVRSAVSSSPRNSSSSMTGVCFVCGVCAVCVLKASVCGVCGLCVCRDFESKRVSFCKPHYSIKAMHASRPARSQPRTRGRRRRARKQRRHLLRRAARRRRRHEVADQAAAARPAAACRAAAAAGCRCCRRRCRVWREGVAQRHPRFERDGHCGDEPHERAGGEAWGQVCGSSVSNAQLVKAPNTRPLPAATGYAVRSCHISLQCKSSGQSSHPLQATWRSARRR